MEEHFQRFLNSIFEQHTGYFSLDDKNVYMLKFSSAAVNTCEISLIADKITRIAGPVRRFIRRTKGLPLLYEKKSTLELKYEGVFRQYAEQVVKEINDALIGQIKGAI